MLIEEAQTQIKLIISNNIMGYAGFRTYAECRAKIRRIIKECVDEIESKELKKLAYTNLNNYAEKLLRDTLITLGVPAMAVLVAFDYYKRNMPIKTIVKQYIIKKPTIPEAIEIAQPTQQYDKLYMEKVRPALERLIDSEPMYDSHVSLRNIAEMTVRYENTLRAIADLKSRGINLVQSSRHANCSKRCEPWQGKYYTLDGTYKIVDNIQFQPLENATDQYYTTRTGKVYKNGHITGYNCRHYLIPYRKGYSQPMVSAKTIERERSIDHRMRAMERQIRHWKTKAIVFKGKDQNTYQKAKFKANLYYNRYKQFAERKGRAYYPSRVDIL